MVCINLYMLVKNVLFQLKQNLQPCWMSPDSLFIISGYHASMYFWTFRWTHFFLTLTLDNITALRKYTGCGIPWIAPLHISHFYFCRWACRVECDYRPRDRPVAPTPRCCSHCHNKRGFICVHLLTSSKIIKMVN